MFADPAATLTGQEQAATVLLSLLSHDLPSASWRISNVLLAHDQAGSLDGQLSETHYATGMDHRKALDAWAAHLDATPTWSPRASGAVTGQVKAELNGVKVCVWTHLQAPADSSPTEQERAATAGSEA